MIDEVKKWSEDVLFRIVDLGIWNDLVSLKLLISAKVYIYYSYLINIYY